MFQQPNELANMTFLLSSRGTQRDDDEENMMGSLHPRGAHDPPLLPLAEEHVLEVALTAMSQRLQLLLIQNIFLKHHNRMDKMDLLWCAFCTFTGHSVQHIHAHSKT